VAAGPSWCCLFCVCVGTVVWLPIETKQIESRRKYDTLTIRGGGEDPLSRKIASPSYPSSKKTRPPSQPTPRKKSPFPPTTLKKPTIFPVPTHQKIAPFPQSEPQKRQKRFNRRRSRSAEQIVMIFTSNYSSQQS
jgi:hypothetical protein